MRLRGIGYLFSAVAFGAVTSGLAVALAGSAAVSAAAVPAPSGWTHVPGTGYLASSSSCSVALWTSQVSAGDPPYVSAQAFQLSAPFTCAGTLQRSTDGGKTWSQAGAQATVPAITTKVVNFFANTSAAYDGPGYSTRACAKASNAALTCTAAITLGPGTGTPLGVVLPASTARAGSSAGNTTVICGAELESTTLAKGTGSRVDGVFNAGSSSSTSNSQCKGWLETSANKGKTWQVFSPTVTFSAPAKTVTYGYIGTRFDGTPHLARACVEAPTVSAKVYCTFPW